ncbi:MAG TPA: 4a-hydroxytetrahydrobiopterin dehydratase [Gemmatimonadaceae bacterium]|nr:4a-hydroxytetrahydrobiopterin dehydratase [Gemmatimonadaceae bacterium]
MPRQDRTYTAAEAAPRLATLPGWSIADGWLVRRFTTDGWPTTLMLVNAIGFIAEAADHHPDLEVAWSSVVVKLRTHSAKGITDKDLELAARIDEVALWRPEPGRAAGLSGTARPFVRPDAPK